MKLHLPKIAALVAAGLLAACGGGNDSATETTPPAASNEVPASATTSATAYSLYTLSLTNSETATPLNLDNVTAPASETDAPITF